MADDTASSDFEVSGAAAPARDGAAAAVVVGPRRRNRGRVLARAMPDNQECVWKLYNRSKLFTFARLQVTWV